MAKICEFCGKPGRHKCKPTEASILRRLKRDNTNFPRDAEKIEREYRATNSISTISEMIRAERPTISESDCVDCGAGGITQNGVCYPCTMKRKAAHRDKVRRRGGR